MVCAEATLWFEVGASWISYHNLSLLQCLSVCFLSVYCLTCVRHMSVCLSKCQSVRIPLSYTLYIKLLNFYARFLLITTFPVFDRNEILYAVTLGYDRFMQHVRSVGML